MTFLIIILILNFSCSNNESSKTISGNTKPEKIKLKSREGAIEKLKYTSGIRSILNDSKGNYWFGSHSDGLCLYDGKSYTYFTIENNLSDLQVRTIQEDEKGRIWFGTANGVSSYSYKSKAITNHTSKNSFSRFVQKKEGEWKLTKNDLWFNAGNEAGVYRFDGNGLTYLTFPIVGDRYHQYATTDFSRTADGNIWIATYSAAFNYDGSSFKVIDDASLEYIDTNQKLHIRNIFEDSKGRLWIANNGIGVLLTENGKTINFSKKQNLIPYPNSRNSDFSPSGTLAHVFAIGEDLDGNIWFGDRDSGAWKYDGASIFNYKIDLPTQNIWQIYQDRNGDLLFAMAGGGVYLFSENSFVRKF